MTSDAKLEGLIETASRAAIVLRENGRYELARELEHDISTVLDEKESRPIVGDRVKISGGEYIGFVGTYVADRDNGTARYPVIRLADGRETFVPDPMHLRKL
jgi:putative ribosome biogenesis GTPase RsgA